MAVPGRFAQDAVRHILFFIQNDQSAVLPGRGDYVRHVDIASHLHIAYREEAYYLLREQLRVRDEPVQIRTVKGIDGQRYVESLYAADASQRLAIAEARKASGSKASQFSQAYVLISPSDAFMQKPGWFGRNDKLVPVPQLVQYLNGIWWEEPLDYGPCDAGNMTLEELVQSAELLWRPRTRPEGMND